MKVFLSRKYTLSVGVIFLIVLLLATELINQSTFQNIIIAVLGFYAGGNVGEHFAKKE